MNVIYLHILNPMLTQGMGNTDDYLISPPLDLTAVNIKINGMIW